MAFVHRRAGVRVDGLTEARVAFENLPEAFRTAVARSIDAGTAVMLAESQARVPVAKGDLKRSGGRNVREDGLQTAVGYGDVAATFQEFGTKRHAAQPFLLPAFRKGARLIRARMRNWAREAAEEVKFRTKRSKRSRSFSRAARERAE